MNAVVSAAPRSEISNVDIVATGGRLLLAAIFLLSGVSKIADPAGTIAYIASAGLPLPKLAFAAAIALEVIGGLFLVFGFKARAVALSLAGFTALTALIFHSALSDPNEFIHFFKNIAIVGGLLQVWAFGAGRLSVGR